MRLNLLIATLILISFTNYAQNSNLVVDLHYPVPIDNNFVGENYNGVIGLGIEYHFLDIDPVKVGISVNGGFLSENTETGQGNTTLTTFQPRAVAELKLTSNGKIRPYIGIGYSFLFFKGESRSAFDNPETTTVTLTEEGLNINGGLTFNFTNRFLLKHNMIIYTCRREMLWT
ncbi:outer membrane beta-barrel protein [Costertonia aggregata]|uniref:Outer membrane beta-barrel protein n=1 Tax=Costertonia aggregata TaxID=343403 RepID=A0A7H9AR59_9FLAO|nr:outer membrane beta-barrel protein [Costertonia aggregata]QLG45899.1 outer membrane beta-barrel protein [Costertonia aggregata]